MVAVTQDLDQAMRKELSWVGGWGETQVRGGDDVGGELAAVPRIPSP